jgi:hypothetical protein
VDISPVASVLFVLISFAPLGVQNITAAQGSKASHPHYAVKDLGTFGGCARTRKSGGGRDETD